MREASRRSNLHTVLGIASGKEQERPRNDGRYLFLKPRLIQLKIHALLCEQFTVRALFDDAAIVDDDNSIRAGDGGQPMRDHEGCASL